MAPEREPPDLLSHFWTPLTAIGAHGGGRLNAQICVSVFGASIVPERPRLLVNLSRTNLTHDLVRDSGSMAITLLSRQQLHLLGPLGTRSGHDGDKLADIPHGVTEYGDPFFPDGTGILSCLVLDSFDLGDATAFLVAVGERQPLGGGPALSWGDARSIVDETFLERWRAKNARDREVAQRLMTWLPGEDGPR